MEHSFDILHAKHYGIAEAVMIKNFQFWIAKNKANKTHQYDDRTWTYNSVKAFEELFPYLTSSQIRRCLESLVEKGVLIKGDYNKNKYVRTSWFAFNNESMFLNQQMDLSNSTNGIDDYNKCITDNKPNEKPNNNPPISPKGESVNIDYKGLSAAVNDWLEYKEKEKKQKYKGPKSVQAMINSLYQMSNGNPDKAMAIVQFSMGNNYAGLIDPTQSKYKSASAQQQSTNAPVKHKVEYYNIRWPDNVKICTEEQLEQIRQGNPEETFEVVRKYQA